MFEPPYDIIVVNVSILKQKRIPSLKEIGYRRPRPSKVVQVVKNLPANTGDLRDPGSITGSGRSQGEGHGNPHQYSYLENPIDRESYRQRSLVGYSP